MAGSIEEKGKGVFRLVVSAGTGPNGKRKKHTKTIHAKNKTEAKKH